jgi:hypothetical protein
LLLKIWQQGPVQGNYWEPEIKLIVEGFSQEKFKEALKPKKLPPGRLINRDDEDELQVLEVVTFLVLNTDELLIFIVFSFSYCHDLVDFGQSFVSNIVIIFMGQIQYLNYEFNI